MLYFVAWLLPFAAVLACDRPWQGLLNMAAFVAGCCLIAFYGLGFVILLGCVIHAFCVVAGHYEAVRVYRDNARTNAIIRAIRQSRQ